MYPVGAMHSAWDIVTETIEEDGQTKANFGVVTLEVIIPSEWKRYNNFALLTMGTNSESTIATNFGLFRQVYEAYIVLKTEFEGKSLTDIGPVLAGVIKLEFDNRKATIEEHINEYKCRQNLMTSSLSGSQFSEKQKGFREGLTRIANNDAAKAQFLLLTISSYYSATVENIRNKEYRYGDVVRQLKHYVPERQKGCSGSKKNGGTGSGTAEDPIVLKVEDNGKRYTYCIKVKKWKEFNYTQSECRTKKREREKDSEEAKKADDFDNKFVKIITLDSPSSYLHPRYGLQY